MRRIGAGVVLPLRFLAAVVTAGLQTARTILHLGHTVPRPGFVRLTFAPLTPTGAALLGALVTLTPGTTVIDIDVERCELLLHMLDTEHLAQATAAIRRDFEPALQAWFGAAP
jgi:multisubunit Na+/H+ antiporter MnhE subunit